MAERLEVYKCEACGNIVEVLHGGGGELVCCGDPMVQMVENTVDAAKEKHVPVIEKVEGGVKVKVGDVPHPMEEKHYIEWIEVIVDGKADRGSSPTLPISPLHTFPTVSLPDPQRTYCTDRSTPSCFSHRHR